MILMRPGSDLEEGGWCGSGRTRVDHNPGGGDLAAGGDPRPGDDRPPPGSPGEVAGPGCRGRCRPGRGTGARHPFRARSGGVRRRLRGTQWRDVDLVPVRPGDTGGGRLGPEPQRGGATSLASSTTRWPSGRSCATSAAASSRGSRSATPTPSSSGRPGTWGPRPRGPARSAAATSSASSPTSSRMASGATTAGRSSCVRASSSPPGSGAEPATWSRCAQAAVGTT